MSYSSLLVDLRRIHKGEEYEHDVFLSNYAGLDLHKCTLSTLWKVTKLGYGCYELYATDITLPQLRNMRKAGFHIQLTSSNGRYRFPMSLKSNMKLLENSVACIVLV